MSATHTFIKKHWFTLVLLLASMVGVRWYVLHSRAPGSMTVLEAQGMDMTSMKPPHGSMPVSVETVRSRSMSGGQSFPAVVSALTEEDIVARVPGRLSRLLVYPGDHVTAGQLLGTIEAPEYDAEQKKAQSLSGAKSAEAISAQRLIAHHRNILVAANARAKESSIAKSRAKTEAYAAAFDLEKAKSDAEGLRSEKAGRQAELTFAEAELSRQQILLKDGFVSLAKVQAAQRDRDAANARVQTAEASIQSALRAVRIAEKRLEAANQSVDEADAMLQSAKAEVAQAKDGIEQAYADARAASLESTAAQSEAQGAGVVADYRQLTALAEGVVSERVVSPGTAVTAGQVILRLKSVSKVRVQADMPQAFSTNLQPGTRIRVITDSTEIGAELTSVFPTVDPQTRTFRIESLLPNPDGALKPGMFARIRLDSGGKVALAVRSVAVQSDELGKFVWIVQTGKGVGPSDWTCVMHPEVSKPGPGKCPICGMDLSLRKRGGASIAHRQRITVSRRTGDFSEVIAGLKEGDQVIVAGFDYLTEGMAVSSNSTSSNPEEPARSAPQLSASPKPRLQPKPKPAPQIKPAATTFEYSCPMDADVHSKQPGKCPKCGMDLVKREIK